MLSHEGHYANTYSLAGIHTFPERHANRIADDYRGTSATTGASKAPTEPKSSASDLALETVKKAVGDGRIDDNKTLFEKGKNKDVVNRYEKYLNGKVLSEKELKVQISELNGSSRTNPRSRTAANQGNDGIAQLEAQIKANNEVLNDSSLDLTADAKSQIRDEIKELTSRLDAKKGAEDLIVKDYKRRTALIGVLEVKKLQLRDTNEAAVDPIIDDARKIISRLGAIPVKARASVAMRPVTDMNDLSEKDIQAALRLGKNGFQGLSSGGGATKRALVTALTDVAKKFAEVDPKKLDDRIDDIDDTIDDLRDMRSDTFKVMSKDTQNDVNRAIHLLHGAVRPARSDSDSANGPYSSPDSIDRGGSTGSGSRPTSDDKTGEKPRNTNDNPRVGGGNKPGATDPGVDTDSGAPATGGTTDGTEGTTPTVIDESNVINNHGGLGTTYTVQRGDSLSQIANNYNKTYGMNITWQQIFEANKGTVPNLTNPDLIYSGQVFTIPQMQKRIHDEMILINAANAAGA